MKRQVLGLAAVALLAFGLGCVKDPTSSLRGTGVAVIQTSVSYVQVNVADSVVVTATELDGQGNILTDLPEVTSLTPTVVSVSTANLPPTPGQRFYVKALTYGVGKVLVTAGDLADTVDVQTWPAAITITGVADTLRSGATATVTLTALDAAGNPVAGVPISLATNDASVLAVDTASLMVTAIKAGLSTLTATGPHDVTKTFLVRVIPAVPASAELSKATFGAVGANGTSTLELLVLDAAGNQNTNIPEITSVTVSSSDPSVATVAATVVDTAADGTERHIYVTATGQSAGTADITGSVTTTTGTFDFAAVPVVVLAPQITVSSPSTAPAATITINGVGFAAAGFETLVLVDGAPVGNVVSVSSTQITAQMPTLMAGPYDLEVSVGGVVSNTDTWTQTADFNEAATEPNNDVGEEAPISASFDFSGTTDITTDLSDLFKFTVTTDSLVMDLTVTFTSGSDIDAAIYPIGAQNPGDYAVDACDGALSTSHNPETGVCKLGTAGTYTLEIFNYAGGPTSYTVKGTIRKP
jgi:hypothetical protein